jgi:hypothetical protein
VSEERKKKRDEGASFLITIIIISFPVLGIW